MATRVKAIAFLLRTRGKEITHISTKRERNNHRVKKETTQKNLKALVELGTGTQFLEKVPRIQHDIRFFMKDKVTQNEQIKYKDITYNAVAIEDYTDITDFYVVLGKKSEKL